MAHALAAEYLGMACVYLDAGSGADRMVPVEMIRAVKDYVSIPVIVGGGNPPARGREGESRGGC